MAAAAISSVIVEAVWTVVPSGRTRMPSCVAGICRGVEASEVIWLRVAGQHKREKERQTTTCAWAVVCRRYLGTEQVPCSKPGGRAGIGSSQRRRSELWKHRRRSEPAVGRWSRGAPWAMCFSYLACFFCQHDIRLEVEQKIAKKKEIVEETKKAGASDFSTLGKAVYAVYWGREKNERGSI